MGARFATGHFPRLLSAHSYAGDARPDSMDQALEGVYRPLDPAPAQQLDVGEHSLRDAREDGARHDVGELARGDAVLSLADVAQLEVGQVERYALPLEAGVGHRHFRAANREALDHQAVARSRRRLGRGLGRPALRIVVALDALLDRVEVGAPVAALVD